MTQQYFVDKVYWCDESLDRVCVVSRSLSKPSEVIHYTGDGRYLPPPESITSLRICHKCKVFPRPEVLYDKLKSNKHLSTFLYRNVDGWHEVGYCLGTTVRNTSCHLTHGVELGSLEEITLRAESLTGEIMGLCKPSQSHMCYVSSSLLKVVD